MDKFFNLEHPMYRPLWVRALITLACAMWAVIEFVSGSAIWGVMILAAAVYCGWQFFVVYPPSE
jgi:hypothetical protein